MPSCEELFKEIKLNFPHYCYYNKALKAKGFKLDFLMYSDEGCIVMRYKKYSEKLGKSLNVEINDVEINDKIIAVSVYKGSKHNRLDDEVFFKTFGGETLKKAWNNMCGDEEILKKFSEFESL